MSTYFYFAIIPLLIGLYAQFKVQSAYRKYSAVRTQTGVTGSEAARRMLDEHGLQHVRIEHVQGTLSDHYDPRNKVLRLSSGVYDANSVAAVGVACHEAGHAYQDAEQYGPLKLRSAMIPAVNIGSRLGPILFMVGLILSGMYESGVRVAEIGLAIFALTAVFSIVTLPVEFDASKRGKEWLEGSALLYNDEILGVEEVLRAAAMTYVSAAVQSIANVMYYASILGSRNNDRRRR
ncbi:MAG: zinc metallopeptidase [Anaerolineaceae bacterium]|nr:zinc metallopeptidase [Anaerolineaceae bacterium]